MPAAELYKFSESANPVMEMLAKIGDLSKVKIGGGRVLVWTYIRPAKTAGGIYLTDTQKKEDVWQGTVGYVLKRGPLAFKDDPAANINFAGFEAKEGDWVQYIPGDGKRIQINGIDCRVMEDTQIAMILPDPDLITHRQ